MKLGKKLAKLWKKKLTKLIVAVALIATGNEFVGVPILKELMTPDQIEKVIEIEATEEKVAPVKALPELESSTDTDVAKPLKKEDDK